MITRNTFYKWFLNEYSGMPKDLVIHVFLSYTDKELAEKFGYKTLGYGRFYRT